MKPISHLLYLYCVCIADLKADQFVKADDGIYKLNDFNRGRLMHWNTTSNSETCPYSMRIGMDPNKYASPEEYLNQERNELLDTYSMGNVLFSVLTSENIFARVDQKRAVELVKEGKKPKLGKELRRSNHPVDRAFIEAMSMCFVYDRRERFNSTEIRDFLVDAYEKIR